MDAPKFPTPSIFPLPPRHVRAKPTGCGGRGAMVIYALLLLGGALSLLVAPVRWHIQSHGSPVRATIENKYITRSSRNVQTRHADFSFQFDGETVHDNEEITTAEFGRINPGMVFGGKASRILGHVICLVDLGDGDDKTFRYLFSIVIINAILWLLIGLGALSTLRIRRLVQMGAATPGTVTNRRITRGRSTYCYVAYRFTTAAGETLTHERSVSRVGYNGVDIGSPVTVLYDQARPGRSLVYECCNYTVD